MTDGDKEKSKEQPHSEAVESGQTKNKGVVIIAGIVIAVILGVVLFSNSQGNKAPGQGGNGSMAQDLSDDDGWIKVVRPNSSDVVVMQFVLRSLPQCRYFHFQTLMDGRAMGVRCFEKSDREKPDYYYVLSGTSEFLGPYRNENTMRARLEEMIESLQGEAEEADGETQEDTSGVTAEGDTPAEENAAE